MPSGRLIWVGDHFAPIELAQLRRDRERKALVWLHDTLTNVSSTTDASLSVLLIPENSIKTDALLDLDPVHSIEPPLNGVSTGNGGDAEGKYFTATDPTGRVKILYNGVIEGISHLNKLSNADQRVNLNTMQDALEENIRYYRKAQRSGLDLGERAWLAVSLHDASNLGARYQHSAFGNFANERQRLTVSQLVIPEIILDDSAGATATRDVVVRIFKVIHRAFGL